jgi:hypothetical protein
MTMEPRKPTPRERRDLRQFLAAAGYDDPGFWVRTAALAVFPDYQPYAPTDWGTVMVVVWGHGPHAFDVFLWRAGVLECLERVS